MEMAALGKGLICSLTNPVNSLDSYVSKECLGFLKAKFFHLEILVVEAVRHKVDQIRYNRLSALSLQKFCKVVIGCREEFNQESLLQYQHVVSSHH